MSKEHVLREQPHSREQLQAGEPAGALRNPSPVLRTNCSGRDRSWMKRKLALLGALERTSAALRLAAVVYSKTAPLFLDGRSVKLDTEATAP